MHVEHHAVTVTTIADGSATAYSPVVTGRIHAIAYVKTDFADGVDFTITTERLGEGLWTDTNINASEIVYPRVGVQDPAGAAATTDGTRLLRDSVHVANDRVKIVIAASGATKTGTFHLIIA